MQDNGPQWDPSTIDRIMPWEPRLFVLFLFVVAIFLLVRVTQLSWFLWRSKAVSPLPGSDVVASGSTTVLVRDLAIASIRAVSLKTSATLTLLLSLTVSAEELFKLLNSVRFEKSSGISAIAGAGAEIMSVFALAVGVCAMLYAAFAIFDGRLSRLRLRLEHHC